MWLLMFLAALGAADPPVATPKEELLDQVAKFNGQTREELNAQLSARDRKDSLTCRLLFGSPPRKDLLDDVAKTTGRPQEELEAECFQPEIVALLFQAILGLPNPPTFEEVIKINREIQRNREHDAIKTKAKEWLEQNAPAIEIGLSDPNDPKDKEASSLLSRSFLVRSRSVSVLVTMDGFVESKQWRDQLKTAIELRLRTQGVPVNDKSELPSLSAYFKTIENNGVVAVTAQFELLELVTTRKGVEFLGPTWGAERHPELGLLQKREFESVRDLALRYVDEFCNDYLAANPKQP